MTSSATVPPKTEDLEEVCRTIPVSVYTAWTCMWYVSSGTHSVYKFAYFSGECMCVSASMIAALCINMNTKTPKLRDRGLAPYSLKPLVFVMGRERISGLRGGGLFPGMLLSSLKVDT